MYLSCMQWKARYPVSNAACGIVNHNSFVGNFEIGCLQYVLIHLVINRKQMQTDEFI